MKNMFSKEAPCNCEGVVKKIVSVIFFVCFCAGIYNIIIGVVNVKKDYDYTWIDYSKQAEVHKEYLDRLSQIECLIMTDLDAYLDERSKISDWYTEKENENMEMKIIRTWKPEGTKILHGAILLFGGTLIFCLIQILCNISIKLN